jgi:uncharacterized membrane protein YdbT with pleckstrin-like domain
MTGAVARSQRVSVHRHPVLLIKPTIVALIGLIAAGVLTETSLRNTALVIEIIWAAWAFLLLRLFLKIAEWAVSYLVVTPQQLSLSSGLFRRHVDMMFLSKVTDISLQTSFLGRLLGYGQLVLQVAGQGQDRRVIDHVPFAGELYRELSSWVV